MAGEDQHDRGDVGVASAKKWLEMSTRVEMAWTRKDRPLKELLEFSWPHGAQTPFSFDLGGKLRGGAFEGQSFLAEVKNYTREGDLPTHFMKFLAGCYVALETHPARCDNFFWISWSPFQATAWDRHTHTGKIKKAVLAHRGQTIGEERVRDAIPLIDYHRIYRVSQRVALITMSAKQQELVMLKEHHEAMIARIISESGAA